MSWQKFTDRARESKKVRRASSDAVVLWWAAGNWCSEHQTDGFIPKDELHDAWRPIDREFDHAVVAKECVKKGLFIDHGDHFEVHDYLEYNPSKAAQEKRKEKDARRAAAYRDRQKTLRKLGIVTRDERGDDMRDDTRDDASDATGDEPSDDMGDDTGDGKRTSGVRHAPPSRPVPSRPDLKEEDQGDEPPGAAPPGQLFPEAVKPKAAKSRPANPAFDAVVEIFAEEYLRAFPGLPRPKLTGSLVGKLLKLAGGEAGKVRAPLRKFLDTPFWAEQGAPVELFVGKFASFERAAAMSPANGLDPALRVVVPGSLADLESKREAKRTERRRYMSGPEFSPSKQAECDRDIAALDRQIEAAQPRKAYS